MRRSLAISAASPNHGHGAIADDVVTMPSRKAAAMPRFTAWHMPKSSPRTISLISSDGFTHASSALPGRIRERPVPPTRDLQRAAAQGGTFAGPAAGEALARILAFVDPCVRELCRVVKP